MTYIAAGRLDRRITIQSRTVMQDGFGAEIASWSDEATVWAEVKPLRGSERWAAMEVAADLPTRFTIRYRAEPSTVDNRIAYKGRIYDIQSVNEIGRRVGWEIYAKARQDKVAA